MSATIDQKEYLKRYLSGGDDKKKKKKKKPKVGTGVKIIDDDADINKRANMNDDDIEFMFQGEDAPQVAAIIDDRPEILKNQDDPDYDKKWKGIGEDGEAAQKLLKKKKKKKSSKSDKKSTKTYSQPSDSDQSPPRINRQNNDAHRSNDRDKDNSRRRSDEDLSPPRRRRRDSDQSPPRRNGRNSPDSDLSPPRREHSEKSSRDISPPRRPRHKESQNDRHRNPRSYASNSSSLKSRKRDHDQSPPRRQARSQDGDVSPPRRRPENDPSHQKRKSRWGPEDEKSREEDTRLKTTLEGRSAGLQDAKRLAQETLDLQRREERMFEQLSDDVSGRNAKAIVRNRGKKETSAEREAQRERTKKQKEREEKYERWGKGVKQAEAQEAKVQDYMHESSKPMARYKNDSDLDHHLKQQDREGDPMLNYLRSKGRGAGPSSQSSGEVLPIYKGSYPINRFNIRPGYRWDGVDRSNGYEKKYFENKNNKIANDADAYKWSTEDM